MAMEIKDGTGTGRALKINEFNQAITKTESIDDARWVNKYEQLAFAAKFDAAAANAAADEVLLYIKNGRDEDLIIDQIKGTISAANIIYGQFVTGTAGGTPTTLYPANMHGGSSYDSESTIYQDDAMSGLSAVSYSMFMWEYVAANGALNFQPKAGIVIPKNQAVAIYVETQQAQTLQGVIYYHYDIGD